ncbi:DUF952 domain-containing protein [Beijerinckia indica]|uniref:Dihydroorotate dehydrogenase n=1 Tax=Beijerinckia indica subsp. indica (strain ATCC 9039 / DSM 1715 / NCIMB 8712) TaxID=395963 RepID=B2IIL7_BEII9|nr:DUF952 domain-containing protein [Beijerinckia indica]ACB94710.1 protein of unknown function DUF952 [Beijerinckia indica subsp. indica ATCC 9039]
MTLIYKIAPSDLWQSAEEKGRFDGSPADMADGFLHFSTKEQLLGTDAKWFKGQDDLVLVAIDTDKLGETLRWEAAREGALFPHLYGALPLTAVVFAKSLPLKPDGLHDFTGLLDETH